MQKNTHATRNLTSTSKHILCCLLALCAFVLLAACGGSTGTGSGTTPTPTATSAPTTGTTPTTATGTTPTTAPTGPTKAVSIITNSDGTFGFSPTMVTIKVGTTVIWTDMTVAPHTVTSDDGTSFDSGASNPLSPQGGTFNHTFTTAGTFAYHCAIHPYMKATIVVTS